MSGEPWRRRRSRLASEDTASLVATFIEAVAMHGKATETGNHRVANRAYRRYDKVRRQLQGRGEEGRNALRDLMSHENGWIRLVAASTCLAVDTNAAERVLSELEREPGFLGHDAKWMLKEWRAGSLRR